jgi:hypothetical protein
MQNIESAFQGRPLTMKQLATSMDRRANKLFNSSGLKRKSRR